MFDWDKQYKNEEEFNQAIDELCLQYLKDSPEWLEVLKNNPRYLSKNESLSSTPMVCKADSCPYAVKCTVLKSLTNPVDRMSLIGTDCRIEVEMLRREFLSRLIELEIKPKDVNDIFAVLNLASLIIHRRRVELDISINGALEWKVTAMNQKGDKISSREMNRSYDILEKVNKQIKSIEDQLMTSRKDRILLQSTSKDQFLKMLKTLKNKSESLPQKYDYNAESANADLISEE